MIFDVDGTLADTEEFTGRHSTGASVRWGSSGAGIRRCMASCCESRVGRSGLPATSSGCRYRPGSDRAACRSSFRRCTGQRPVCYRELIQVGL